MIGPRNIGAALATVREAVAQESRDAVTLHALHAGARLLNAAAVAGFTIDEFRELLELALQPGATVPPGAAGESVLAYLLAMRQGLNPVPHAVNALRRFNDKSAESFLSLAGWLRKAAERDAAQAVALRAEMARRGTH